MGSFFDPVVVESGVTEMNKTSWKGGGYRKNTEGTGKNLVYDSQNNLLYFSPLLLAPQGYVHLKKQTANSMG